MIDTKDLTKVFRTEEIETIALNNVDLKIDSGEFVAVMGPSGCGKTTLINILGLIDEPTKGSYQFLGQDIDGISQREKSILRKKNIGFVFQNFNLIDELNVFENIELPLIYLGVGGRERRQRVEKVMDIMEISHRKRHFPLQLSGGQQQRVAVARAVVSEPKLILADEPTGNLDSVHGSEVMNLLDRLNQNGTTVIIVTHSQRDAEYARRIIRLFDGQIINENIRSNTIAF